MATKSIVSATGVNGSGKTTVTYSDGTTETLTGVRSERNRNPGNLEYNSYTKGLGAVGGDGRFAVFSSVVDGYKAMESLMFDSPKYRDLTVAQAITRYAPPFENDTKRYAAIAAAAAGVPVDTKVSDMTPAQRAGMIAGMAHHEGGKKADIQAYMDSVVAAPGMQAPIDPTQMAQFSAPSIGTPTPADRAAQFSPVQTASLDPTAGFFAAAAQTPETTAKGVMTSGILSPAVDFSPTNTNLSGLLSPSTNFTAPAQLGGVDPHQVTTTNPAGIDQTARSTGQIGTPTQAQRNTQVASADPGFLDNIDIPGSLIGPMPEPATAINTGILSTPQSNTNTREAMGFFSSMGTPQAPAAPETAEPSGAWRGVDMSNLSEPAIGPSSAAPSLAEQYASYQPSKGYQAPAATSAAAPEAPQRSWGPTAGPSQEVDTFSSINDTPVGLLSAYSQMAGSMPADVTNLSGMSVAPDPHTPDPIGAPTNITPEIKGLGPATKATPAKSRSAVSAKGIAKGAIRGAAIAGLPGAVIGGLLSTPAAQRSMESVGGILSQALGGFFSREPDYAGIQAGKYGSGGNRGAGTYGVNGTAAGMGGFEQFGGGFVGPGSGGWADAGQGFGQGSAADWM